jgi:hypothetical protein
MNRRRYFYDCEFIEDGFTIDLISIGIVCEDGRQLYLQSVEFDESKANEWVKWNVLPHLSLCPCCGHKVNHEDVGKCRSKKCLWRTRAQIRDEVLAFINAGEGKPEFWGYCSAYDHVALAQLFGPMINLPEEWPMYTKDLKQWCDELGNPEMPKQIGTEHNALADALYNKRIYHFLKMRESMHE